MGINKIAKKIFKYFLVIFLSPKKKQMVSKLRYIFQYHYDMRDVMNQR